MFNTFYFLGQSWTMELRNGVGLDLEFVDSRPVWVQRVDKTTGTESLGTLPFEGLIILLPFITISIGRCYTEGES